MSEQERSKGRRHSQIVLVDIPLSSISTRNGWVGICTQCELRRFPTPFPEKRLIEDSEGINTEIGGSKDRGWLSSITDDFCIVIKGNGVRNEIGAEITRHQ
jgi:hypothetical protein